MEKYLQIGGMMISKHDKEDLFRILEENGIEYFGEAKQFTDEDIDLAVEYIVNSLAENDLLNIRNIIEEHYDEQGLDLIKDFLEGNFGTGIYHEVFESTLKGHSLELFNKYTTVSWLISDHFESKLGEKVASKY